MLLPLQGELSVPRCTQDAALGYVLIGLLGRYIPVLTYLRKLSSSFNSMSKKY